MQEDRNAVEDIQSVHGVDGKSGNYGLMSTMAIVWGKSQCVYEFDEDLRKSLDQADVGVVSIEMAGRLPYPCVWVPVGRGGFFAMLDGQVIWIAETDEDSSRLEHRWAVVALKTGMTVSESIDLVYPDTFDESVVRLMRLRVSMLLYLCSEEPDITHKPSPMNQARIRRGKSPYHPTIHHVGYRIGAAFRKAKAEREASQGTGGHGVSPAPHMRRAHWHTYWVGKENTPQRRQVVKWLPPIPVNVKSEDDIIPTIHRVSAGR